MALSLVIKVFPSAGKQLITIDKNGTIKCYLKSPPEDGKANKELVLFIAKKVSLDKDAISIIKGATVRLKTIKIETEMDRQALYEKLNLSIQTKLI